MFSVIKRNSLAFHLQSTESATMLIRDIGLSSFSSVLLCQVVSHTENCRCRGTTERDLCERIIWSPFNHACHV